ncbi:FxSxx-COOH cyclophane-containing RiPP peptide [Actinoplanes sp. NPDC049265]|uniref:FxSxx-COOH cyclophane-containing RiPP peptide n=1 Tax=Actinoplanes sp. NPDC049265 TaxID=3363902 RepID=UPI00371C775D
MTDEEHPAEWRSEMVDVSGFTLTELAALTDGDDTVLARSLRRIADDLTSPDEPIAGFNSAL